MPRFNYFSSSATNDQDSIRLAVHKLVEVAEAFQKPAVIVVPTRSNLANIDSVFTADTIRKFRTGKPVTFDNGVSLRLTTEDIVKNNDEPLLVVSPSPKGVTKIDFFWDVPALIFVPWEQKDIEFWLDAHGAFDLQRAGRREPLRVKNAVVVAALEGFLKLINTANGLDERNKRKSMEIFRTLKEAGEVFTPAEIRSWLTRNEISLSDATSFADLAQKALSMTTPIRNKDRTLERDVVDLWRNAAAKNNPA